MVCRYEEKEEKMSMWKRTVEYVNSFKIGDHIFRSQLMNHMYGNKPPRTSSYGTTADNYRRYLTRLGVLEHIDRGIYEVKHHLKKDVTVNEIRLLLDNGVTMS